MAFEAQPAEPVAAAPDVALEPEPDEEPTSAAIQDAFEEPMAATGATLEPQPAEPVAAAPDAALEPQPDEAPPAAIQGAFEPLAAAPEIAFEDDAVDFVSRQVTSDEAKDDGGLEGEAIQDAFSGDSDQFEGPPVAEAEPAAEAEPVGSYPATPPEEFIAPPTEWKEPSPPATREAPPEPASHGPAGEEELMWLGDEFEEAGLEIGSQGWRNADASAQAEPAPVLELSDAELSQLAEDEGWDMSEVEAIRSLLGRPTGAPVDTGMAEAAAEPAEADPSPSVATEFVIAEAQAVDEPLKSEPVESEPVESERGESTYAEASLPDESIQAISIEDPTPARAQVGPPMAGAPAAPSRGVMPPTADPQWLRGRRGPAATAYRRLRRLFPS